MVERHGLVREMQRQPGLLGAEEPLEDAYLDSRFRGGKADSLPIQMLLQISRCRFQQIFTPNLYFPELFYEPGVKIAVLRPAGKHCRAFGVLCDDKMDLKNNKWGSPPQISVA